MMRFATLVGLLATPAYAPKPTYFCDNPAANNYLKLVADRAVTEKALTPAPWVCTYDIYGCTDKTADNYASWVTDPLFSLPYMCQFGGCNDTEAANYDTKATYNDGTCKYHL